MEDKVNYTLVGAFVIALGAALVAGVLWLAAGTGRQKHYDTYQSIAHESVAGLDIGAPVKYLGVDVGKVSEIVIDPANSRQVRLHFLVEHGTPIKQDSEAVMKTQGLTGIAYIELSGGSANSPPLVATADGAIPSIVSKPSLSTRLESVLTTVLASLDRMSTSVNSVMDSDNRAALKQTLADVASLTHAMAAQQAALGAGIADASRAAHNTARASEQFASAIERIATAADAVDKMADTVSRAGESVGAAASGVQQIGVETMPALGQLLGELNQLATSLRQLSEQTERSPNSLLLGAPTLKPGPGERAAR